MYSRAFLDEVLRRVDIIDVINDLMPLKKSKSLFKALCPFHTEKTPSFIVVRDMQLFHCFGCGANGNAFTFVMDYCRFSFPEAVQYICTQYHIAQPPSRRTSNKKNARVRRRAQRQYLKGWRERVDAGVYNHFTMEE